MHRFKIFFFGVILVCFALSTQAFKPVDSPNTGVKKPAGQGSDPFARGLKHMRKISLDDLIDTALDHKSNFPKINKINDPGRELTERINKKINVMHSEARIKRIDKDKLGLLHVRMQQYHRGYPVIGGDFIVHLSKSSEVFAVTGSFAPAIDIDTSNQIQASQARLSATLAIRNGARSPKDSSKLVILDGKLAYEILVKGTQTEPELYKCFIDAKSGDLLYKQNQIMPSAPSNNGSHVQVGGIRLTGEDGTNVTLTGWNDVGGNYFFYNKDSVWGIYNLRTSDWEQRATNSWGSSDPSAVSLAKNFATVQCYVRQVDGLNSFNNAGIFARANVHEGTSYVNAYWDGSDFHFGDGDGIVSGPLTVLDIAGHEYGHAITQYSSDLNYSYESGALNESFSDIYGTLIEFWAQPDGRSSYPSRTTGAADWLCGEDCWLSDVALRDLRSPQRFEQPSYYMGLHWYSGSGDNGGVHYNSGVQNFAFYLLSEGGTGSNDGHPYSITGIGIEHAGEIASYANMHLLTSTSQYRDSRDAWITAASLLGYNITTVGDVWTACGVLPLVKHLAASPSSLAFGSVGVGLTDTLVLNLSNNGASGTIVSSLSFSDPSFSAAITMPITIPGAGLYPLKVLCRPTEYSTRSGTLTITSNADDNPIITIGLSATGSTPAVLSVLPASISVDLLAGDSSFSMLKLLNTGGANLRFTATAIDQSNNSLSTAQYDPSNYLPLEKGAVDTRIGLPVASLRGGADSAGYRWIDSDELGGPVYTWNDISTTGSLLSSVSGCDDCNESRPLSFAFSYYGSTFSNVNISSNGYVTLGTSSSTYSNTPLPSTRAPANIIAAFWCDLNPGVSGDIFFQDFSDRAVIQFNRVVSFGGGTNVTFQIVLNADGTIFMYYNSMTGPLTSATAGIQNQTGSIGLTAAYNTSYLKNNLAIMFSKRPSWLSLMPNTGTVLPHDSISIPVKCNSVSVAAGIYTGMVRLTHNAPNIVSPVAVACTMHVAGIKRLSVSPSNLNFGPVWAGATDTMLLTLRNSGTEATRVTSLTINNNTAFTHSAILPLVVPPSGSTTVRIRFTPVLNVSSNAIIEIISDAADNPRLTLTATGSGIAPPVIAMSPGSFHEVLNPGVSVSRTLSISNAGQDTLRFQTSNSISWLSTNITSGIVLPGSSASISCTFSSSNLVAGSYTGSLLITHNDPNRISPLAVLCTLNVNGIRHCTAMPAVLTFGTVHTGQQMSQTVTLSNSGNAATTISAINGTNAVVYPTATLPLIVPAFGSVSFTVTFRPVVSEIFSGALSLEGNALENPLLIPFSGNGVEPQHITIAPSSINEHLSAGASITKMLSVFNTGGDSLTFTSAAIDQSSTLRPLLNVYDDSHFVALNKGDMDKRVGLPANSLRGGTDAFGYKWLDSDEPNGPAYVWDDIVATGTLLSSVSGCDDCNQQQNISFVFPFYGNNFSSIYVGSNGYVTLGTPSTSLSNSPLPSTSAPINLIAAFWDDLLPASSGDVFFKDYSDHAIIQFNNVALYNLTGYVTFQIVLNRDGSILYYYRSMSGTLTSSTVGIQNQTGSTGLTIAYNTTYIKNNLAIKISKGPTWFGINTTSGTVAPGSSMPLTLTFDATQTVPGSYSGILRFAHNDPLSTSPLDIPVTLLVTTGGRIYCTSLQIGPSVSQSVRGSAYRIDALKIGNVLDGKVSGSQYILQFNK